MAQPQKRTSLRHLREHLVCVLCGGYLIDATTIVECLHSFCKTCIVRYLDSSKFCPICDVQVHKTKPLVNIRMDHTLQDMVYKLVPGLFKEEMKRRREFYKENVDDDDHTGPWPEYYIDDDGEVQRERVIFSNDEQISLSLQLSTDLCIFNLLDYVLCLHWGKADDRNCKLWSFQDGGHEISGKPPKTSDKMDYESSTEMTDCRYLLCPAAVTVSHLKKFIRLKFNLCDRYQIDVYHTDEILQDHYTLMDIAYIYIWRRKGPLRLFYTVYTNPAKRLKRSASSTVTSDVTKDTSIVEMTYNNKVSGPPDHSEKQISSTVQKTTKIDDNLPKIDTKKSECLPNSNVTSSSNCDEFVSSNLETVQKADKKSLQTTQDSKHNMDSNHKPDTPKRKDGISCTSINVPTPHRSFLLGPKPKDKSEKKQKDHFTSTKPRDQILSLPVKHPGGKPAVPQNKSLQHNSKSFPAPKLSNASHTQHNGKPSNQGNSSDDVKITNNNNTTNTSSISPAINSSGDKHTVSKNSIVSDGCVPSDAKKQKLKHDATNKTAIIKNGGDNNVTKSAGHAYMNKPGGSTLSSPDKTRKLLHIPERPIHAYVPMAHYQGMNGLFHYRAHMQDYGNDAPQDLSMKKKTKEIAESNGKSAKSVNDTDSKKPKENENDKNGEVDRYAFTDEDASPVTSRKLQHVKSEPLTLS